jgi:hypothetical protein
MMSQKEKPQLLQSRGRHSIIKYRKGGDKSTKREAAGMKGSWGVCEQRMLSYWGEAEEPVATIDAWFSREYKDAGI